MTLGQVLGNRGGCRLCGAELPARSADAAELALRQHLDEYHGRRLVSREDDGKDGRRTFRRPTYRNELR